MDEKTNQPSRKLPRLRNFNYGSNGYYFITICAHQRRALFSQILPLSDGLSVQNKLTEVGRIAQTQLLKLPERFDGIGIDKYVVMPNHLHAIIAIQNGLDGAKCSLSDVLCAFKSITTKECRKIGVTGAIFQKSFHDHIIRGENDYSEIWAYIEANPMNWKKDCFLWIFKLQLICEFAERYVFALGFSAIVGACCRKEQSPFPTFPLITCTAPSNMYRIGGLYRLWHGQAQTL